MNQLIDLALSKEKELVEIYKMDNNILCKHLYTYNSITPLEIKKQIRGSMTSNKRSPFGEGIIDSRINSSLFISFKYVLAVLSLTLNVSHTSLFEKVVRFMCNTLFNH